MKMIICPRCKKRTYYKYPALSRRDNKTEICSECGNAEAMFDIMKYNAHIQEVYTKEELQKIIDREQAWLTN